MPEISPVAVLNAVQLGAFLTLKVSVLWLGSVVVGVNAYAAPTLTAVCGLPEIVGGELATGLVTVMLKGDIEADDAPSDTVIMMLLYLPAVAATGVPASWPVLELKVAQLGLCAIVNVSVVPPGAEVVGVKV